MALPAHSLAVGERIGAVSLTRTDMVVVHRQNGDRRFAAPFGVAAVRGALALAAAARPLESRVLDRLGESHLGTPLGRYRSRPVSLAPPHRRRASWSMTGSRQPASCYCRRTWRRSGSRSCSSGLFCRPEGPPRGDARGHLSRSVGGRPGAARNSHRHRKPARYRQGHTSTLDPRPATRVGGGIPSDPGSPGRAAL